MTPESMTNVDCLENQLCRVCDEKAAGFHFGAFTCEGCKSFFGRFCNNQTVIPECKTTTFASLTSATGPPAKRVG